MSVIEATKPSAPTSKSGWQQVLRGFGYTGMRISDWEMPRENRWNEWVARVWVIGPPKLRATRKMEREALTVVVVYNDGKMTGSIEFGWTVE